MVYKCKICGYVLDEDNYEEGLNIPAGTKFEDLPSSFIAANPAASLMASPSAAEVPKLKSETIMMRPRTILNVLRIFVPLSIKI